MAHKRVVSVSNYASRCSGGRNVSIYATQRPQARKQTEPQSAFSYQSHYGSEDRERRI